MKSSVASIRVLVHFQFFINGAGNESSQKFAQLHIPDLCGVSRGGCSGDFEPNIERTWRWSAFARKGMEAGAANRNARQQATREFLVALLSTRR
jgi:hypothetical protein